MNDPAPLALLPMQWGMLPELPDVLPLDESDVACMTELRDVLARHGKLSRFAVHLAHRHFELRPGEVLIERPDGDGRTQHVTVGQHADFPEAVPTTWLFEEAGPVLSAAAVYCVCQARSVYAAGACSVHGKSESKSVPGQEQDRLSEKNYQEQEAKKKIGWPVAGHDRRRERIRGPDDPA